MRKERVLYLFERVYIVFSLIYFSNGLFPKDISENDPSMRGQFDPISLLTQLGIFCVLIFLVLLHRNTFAQGLRRAGWLLPLCAVIVFRRPGRLIRFSLSAVQSSSCSQRFLRYISRHDLIGATSLIFSPGPPSRRFLPAIS